MLSGFEYRISELISVTTDSAGIAQQYHNDGTARVDGVQAELEQLWRNGAALRTSLSLQRARDQNGQWLENSPRQLFKLDATAPIPGTEINAGLVLRYVSPRLTRSYGQVPSYLRTGLTLSSERLVNGAEISLGVYNLLDRKYLDPVSSMLKQDAVEQERRSVRLKMTVRF
jgi:iron complex outermembrane receptor protein